MYEFENMHKELGEVDWHDCVHFPKDYAEKWRGIFVDKDIQVDVSWEFGFHKIIQANQIS